MAYNIVPNPISGRFPTFFIHRTHTHTDTHTTHVRALIRYIFMKQIELLFTTLQVPLQHYASTIH